MIGRLLQFRPSTRLPALAASWAPKFWAGALVVLDWVIALACGALLAGGLWIVIGAHDPPVCLNQLPSTPVSVLLKCGSSSPLAVPCWRLIVPAGIALLAAVVLYLGIPEPPQSPEVDQ